MEIIYPQSLISFLKHKHLLLDTNVFVDASIKSSIFTSFFNTLKKSDVTLTTLDVVKYEVLKGSTNQQKYREKELFIDNIIDAVIPLTKEIDKLTYELILQYAKDGAGVSIADLLLGAVLMQYGTNICLMTRDTTDFIQRIFKQ